jgi:EipB-like
MDHHNGGVSRVLSKVLWAGLFLSVASSAMAAAIAPHRAIYDLELLHASSGAAIGSVSGRLAFEVSGSECDGWTVNFRIVNQFDYKEGNSRLIDTRSSSWETGDGREMNYNQQEFVDNKPEGDKRLSVTRSDGNAAGEGVITSPAEKKFSIAAETVFPMRHQLRLMQAAERGESRDTALVFDGSDEEKTVRAISTIGKKVDPGASKDDNANPVAAPLKTLISWPVTIGYYDPLEANAETPIYQISFDMYENGVSTGLVMDYGKFALRGKLSNLELLKPETCK